MNVDSNRDFNPSGFHCHDVTYTPFLRRWLSVVSLGSMLLLSLTARSLARDENSGSPVPPPVYRVESSGFDASEADIRKVLDSACGELWSFFPDYKMEPIVVRRGKNGPITLYQRENGELVVELDTSSTLWCQYSYQAAHEFCHCLTGCHPAYEGNKWFEETLAETASLFAMRAMARDWKESPPYPNWKDYRDNLRDYCDDIIRKRDKVYEIYTKGLSGFYRAHKDEMEKNSTNRELTGAMSLVFLHLLEEKPARWEAVRWLNSTPAVKGDTFAMYLQKWHDAVPARHQAFVNKVAVLYGETIKSSAAPEEASASLPVYPADPNMARYRVDVGGFQAGEKDIRKVLSSAGGELWRYFPGYQLEPIVVVHGEPSILYARNPQGEIVIQLSAEKAYWCQYAFQFSGLFADALCGFNAKSEGNKWFETTVCDAATLFAMKQMSVSWEKNPPYPGWKEYRHSIAQYVQDEIKQRENIEPKELNNFYASHREDLAKGTDTRSLSQAMAVVLLQLFEARPEHWESIRWLNSAPSAKGEPFEKYLQRWQRAVPEKHRPFVKKVAEQFGVTMPLP
ncbi:MAG: hypothetical protein WCK89_12860 [bacterium]